MKTRKISRKEIRRISKRISSIDKNIEAKRRSVKVERKELKRVERYSRISSGREHLSSIEDIRGIVASRAALSTDELGALLESGGLSTISETKKRKVSDDSKGCPGLGKRAERLEYPEEGVGKVELPLEEIVKIRYLNGLQLACLAVVGTQSVEF